MREIFWIGLVSGGIALVWFYRHTRGRPLAWLRVQFGWGHDVRELARRLGVDVDRLCSLTPAYRERFIPKKRGGQRRLLIPDDELKSLQRRVLRRLLAKLRTHPAAKAYERGKSIVDNAKPHVGQAVVIKIDLVDFFPSCRAEDADQYFRFVGWNRDAAALLTSLCTHEGGLPQGAPSSPRLSNLLMFGFDCRVNRFVTKRKGAYTRYADDITISFPKDYPRRIRGAIQFVARAARSRGLTVHRRKKLLILRRHQQQRVTGLVVNAKLQVPRSVRRKLRAIEHHAETGRQATLTPQQMHGWRAFLAMVRKG
jgi:retron-type reverse transcriptase